MEAIYPNWTILIGFLLWGASYWILRRFLFLPYLDLLSRREELVELGEGSQLKTLKERIAELEHKIASERQHLSEELKVLREQALLSVRSEGERLLRETREAEEKAWREEQKRREEELQRLFVALPEVVSPLISDLEKRLGIGEAK